MPIQPSTSVSHATPAPLATAGNEGPAPSAFARVPPRNTGALQALQPPPPAPLDLLQLLRSRCLQRGAPATIEFCLEKAQAMPPAERAVLLQRLCLALADDLRMGSPCGPVDPRADACDTYRLLAPQSPPSHAHYLRTLRQLHEAVAGCALVMHGTYGFIQQSTACRAALLMAVTPEQVRTAVNGWLNWQWSALAAVSVDPLLRAPPGHDPLGPTRVAYALDEPSALQREVTRALASAVPLPPLRDGGH